MKLLLALFLWLAAPPSADPSVKDIGRFELPCDELSVKDIG